MTKGPPWMPLDVAAYLRDTTHLSAHEHGAYMLLIMRYWQDGGLPDDEMLIRRYSLLSAEQWIESRPVLAALFDQGWRHKRIDAELAKAAEIIDKRRSAAEQRHSRSTAHGEPAQSTSAYADVPPSPQPLPTPPPSSRREAASERDVFAELWQAFPRNPSSSTTRARAAFDRLKVAERPDTVAAARRYARWFALDCVARGRSIEAGLPFVPHLGKWLDSGEWRDAAKLIVKGEADPSLTVIEVGSDDFKALVRHRGKAPFVGESGKVTVPVAELERARAGA